MSDSSTSPTGASRAPGARHGAVVATRSTRNEKGQRVFLRTEDAIVRMAHAGLMHVRDACASLRCSTRTLARRMRELGLPVGAERNPIAAEAADPPRAAPGRTEWAREPAVASSLAASAAQLAPAERDHASGGGALSGRRRREFTVAEDDIVRAAAAGRIRHKDAQQQLRCGEVALYRRMRELGLPRPLHSARTRIPGCPPGWFPIAHGGQGKWRLYDGSPITIEAARAAVAAGRATMAQRRVDGGFDLLFRAHHPEPQPAEDPWPTT